MSDRRYESFIGKKLRNTQSNRDELALIRSIVPKWTGGYVPDRVYGMVRVGPPDVGIDRHPEKGKLT